MQESPLVSIIIPTCNDGPVVRQAIDCALNQSYKNVEIIVVDDGSTDGTEEMLKKKYQGRITLVRQENKGTGGARNTGIRCASGKYLQFLDADDLLDPDKISSQIQQLENISGKALSYSDYARCYINDMTARLERLSPVLQNEKPFDDIMMKWETELSIPVHCFLFDMALFKECGIAFDESLQANEDWDCWMNVFALHPKVIFVDRVLALYRIRRDSRCRDRIKMRKSYLAAIGKQIKKHSSDKDVVKKLNMRKKEIERLYRDVSLMTRTFDRCPNVIKNLYLGLPWRIRQRIKLALR